MTFLNDRHWFPIVSVTEYQIEIYEKIWKQRQMSQLIHTLTSPTAKSGVIASADLRIMAAQNLNKC